MAVLGFPGTLMWQAAAYTKYEFDRQWCTKAKLSFLVASLDMRNAFGSVQRQYRYSGTLYPASGGYVAEFLKWIESGIWYLAELEDHVLVEELVDRIQLLFTDAYLSGLAMEVLRSGLNVQDGSLTFFADDVFKQLPVLSHTAVEAVEVLNQSMNKANTFLKEGGLM